MDIVTSPSAYYLLIILTLAYLKKYIFYRFGIMKKESTSSKVYEIVLSIVFVVYALYVIAYEYHGLRLNI